MSNRVILGCRNAPAWSSCDPIHPLRYAVASALIVHFLYGDCVSLTVLSSVATCVAPTSCPLDENAVRNTGRDGSDAFFRYLGIDDAYRASGRSLYTVETHLRNLREAAESDELALTLRVLGVDRKRVHIAHEILLDAGDDNGTLLATGEQLLLHVDSTAGRTSPLPEVLHERLERVARAHATLPVPDWVGRVIRIPGEGAGEGQAWTSS